MDAAATDRVEMLSDSGNPLITYTVQGGPLDGITLRRGVLVEAPGYGIAVEFTHYDNTRIFKDLVGRKVIRKGQGITLTQAGRPGLVALVEQAQAMIRDRDRRRAEKEAEAGREAEATRATCPAGHVPCRRQWTNGDAMTACYVTEDGVEVLDSDLLGSHDGWYWIPSEKVERARAERATRTAAGKEQQEARRARQAEAIARARETGREVEVERWTEACDGSVDECSLDVCVRSARPDGTLFVARIHSF